MNTDAKEHARILARELTLALADALGVELNPDQAIDLYQRFRDGIQDVLGEALEDLAACGELE